MRVWVWGSNYSYTLEAQLVASNGKVHTIPFGSLEYLGWRHLTVNIPSIVEALSLARFVVRTAPSERAHDFQIYFDEITALAGVPQTYDRVDLLDPDKVNELWNA
ncbi:flagellar filament outer layer protein FlaA [Nocardia brasiliensis]|uniref:flagellar filament outer layer protein FlaA n=1 Tax=Nocardia brasiliensis TaxID=37326 RepID=UPI0023B198C7|nr:flagellar filament outer layer protein FlaA [Nocardia brasiliensis]